MSAQTRWSGAIVALVTPFRDGEVDEAKLRKLVSWQIESGINGLVVCGTTGEAPTLSSSEQERVIRIAVETSAGRVPVIAGTGSYSTAEAIKRTRDAQQAGADAALVVCPYYNRPTQEGLYQHFRAVAESGPLPLLVYNLPIRTAVNLEPDTLARLASDCNNIVGVKEGSASLDQMTTIVLECGQDFALLSSDDSLALPCIAIGGRGVVSTIANLVPADVATLTRSALAGDWAEARRWHQRLFPLARVAFIETNPIPIKEAMALLELIEPEFRLPMCRMGAGNLERLARVVRTYGPRRPAGFDD